MSKLQRLSVLHQFIASIALVGLAFSIPMAHAATLKGVRLISQPEKTDLVLDLDSPAGDIAKFDHSAVLTTFKFPGRLDLQSSLEGVESQKLLESLQWSEKDGQVQLTLRRAPKTAVRALPLRNPDRLLISITEAAPPQNSVQQVAPGVVHRHLVKAGNRGPLNINVLELDLQNPNLVIEPVLAATGIHGKAKVSDMVNRKGALAGINASFFKPDSGTCLGTLILNKELIAGPIYDRVTMGIGEDRKPQMARITMRGSLTNSQGDTLPIHTVNQPRLKREQWILYTSRWGQRAPDTSAEYTQVQIDGGKVTAMGNYALPIPRDGFVLVGPTETLGNRVVQYETVGLNVYTVPDWSHMVSAVSGGPYLVKDGSIYVDIREQAFRPGEFTKPAPRTAVGYTADNRVLMVTVDGRQRDVSVGVTLHEMARLMKDLGAVEAMNLDGGSSTQMVVKGRLVNSPSVAGGARVSSALVVRLTEPGLLREIIGASNNVPSPTNF